MRTKSPLQAEKILIVAARFFATHRFHEARMEDIAAAAEVGKGTIYRYFRDKEELYLALLQRAAEQMLQRLHEAVAQTVDPQLKLEGIAAAFLEYFDEHPHLLDLIQHAEAMHKSEQDFPWQRTRDEAIHLLREVFDEARNTGAFSIECTETATLMFLGGLRGIIRFGTKPRSVNLAGQVVHAFLRGVAAEAIAAVP